MTKVKIAEFKSRLSKFIGQVRLGGEVVITDRDTPVARLVPYGKKKKLIIRPAKYSPKTLSQLKIPPAPPGIDSLKALQEERADDLEELWRK